MKLVRIRAFIRPILREIRIWDLLKASFIWTKVKILTIPGFFYATSNWFPVIGYTLAISGFLSVLDYFNPYVKLDIIRTERLFSSTSDGNSTITRKDIYSLEGSHYMNSIIYHDLKAFREFYKINNFPLPNISKNQEGNFMFRRIFYPSDLEIAEDYDSTYVWSSSYTDMQALNVLYNPRFEKAQDTSFLNELTNSIERQQYRLDWTDPFSIRLIPVSILDNLEKGLKSLYKQNFSKIDYYTFMCAMLYSRRVEHTFRITNNSEIALDNISILIPSPVSKLTGTLLNNIISVKTDYYPSIVFNSKIEENRLVIEIPRMNPRERLSLNVVTRENEILTNKIVASFKEVSALNKRKAIKTTIKVFTFLILLQFLLYREQNKIDLPLKGKKKP